MEKRTWPALKSCKHQPYEAKGGENDHDDDDDRLSELPHEILMSIMSLFTIKEAAQFSVVSRRWNYLWRCFPILIFKDEYPTKPWIARDRLLLPQGRLDFTRMVNTVLESYLGPTINELRVIFDLDVTYESDLDKWLAFAFAKHVKTLEFDLTPQVGRTFSPIDCYTLPLECRWSSSSLHRNWALASLTSLCLKFVNLTDKEIECVLLSCHALENLCIVEGSIGLQNIKMSQTSSLRLKHLELWNCYYLSCIDIKAPKLVSFTLHGPPIALLNIRDSSSLSAVSIGNGNYSGDVVAYAYKSLSQYFSKLENLSWHLLLCSWKDVNVDKWNSGISYPPIMSNLKHLELHVQARGHESLLGWAYLIEGSPVLQKLTLKFSKFSWTTKVPRRNIVKRKAGRPLKNLKTLEHFGYLGLPIDMEFATYVVENSIQLKEVIFTNQLKKPYPDRDPLKKDARECVFEFVKALPQQVAFKFGKFADPCCPISTYPYF